MKVARHVPEIARLQPDDVAGQSCCIKFTVNLLDRIYIHPYEYLCSTEIMSKRSRQTVILQLLERAPAASQDDLRRELAKNGFRVTQATLSRDIHQLKLVKTTEGYSLPTTEHTGEGTLPPVARVVRDFVTDVRQAQNLLVVKTSVGSAQPVAAALDSQGWPESVGTIAGDDTILIISRDKKSASRIAGRLQEMLA